MVLAGLLERLDWPSWATPILRALDKLGKIGPPPWRTRCRPPPERPRPDRRGAPPGGARRHERRDSLASDPLVAGSERGRRGSPGSTRSSARRGGGRAPQRLALDISIARGLTTTPARSTRPSRRSARNRQRLLGRRYDNLAELFTSQALPGSGHRSVSTGCWPRWTKAGDDRKGCTPAPVFIPYFDKDRLHDYLRLASRCGPRHRAEVFPSRKGWGSSLNTPTAAGSAWR